MKTFAAGALLLLVSFPALAGGPLTREEALEALGKGDVEARREGAAWLGETGTMSDVPLLIKALRDPDAVVRGLAEHSLWGVWSRSGDPEVDALFQRGMDQMDRGDIPGAIETFSQVIEKKPEFAEGWNKRATLYYFAGDYARSLADCEEVIKRNPVHFGALSGFGLNYFRLGKLETALDYFERALATNPNLTDVETAAEELKRLLRERRKETI